MRTSVTPRAWYLDALTSLAFGGQAIVLGKLAARGFGPFAAIFVLLFNGGLCWYFGKAAWRGFYNVKSRR